MLQADVEQRKDMGIGQRIVYGLAVPAELDQPGIAQDAQLMGHWPIPSSSAISRTQTS